MDKLQVYENKEIFLKNEYKTVKTMIEYLNVDARWLKRSWDNCPVELRDKHLTQLKDSRGQTVWVN